MKWTGQRYSFNSGKGLVSGSLIALSLFLFSCNDVQKIPATVDFNFHVRPILSDKCFACHGPDASQRKAELRLDTEEGAFALLKDYEDRYAIVPGKPEESEVHYRIFTEDTAEVMPPPSFGLVMSEYEKTIINRWIEQGAEYKPHWAFVKPQKAPLPEVSNPDWTKNELDYFVMARLDEIDLTPNTIADKERLLKRVSFDLTGLPPSLELQDKFLQDNSPNAYEKLVDELLSSSHYGEKMAIAWLDVARYADSHGYQDDGLRTMWPWRDWVIHAFNENYPYDKFVTWQLAGDLLPDKTKETLLATGFNRNHKITQEGGVIDEEYRIEYVTDRTNTFGKTFLGLTYECAKCHDHKYDPISKHDYFGTFAFFNQVPEKGIVGTIDASFADPPNMKITPETVEKDLPFVNMPDTLPVEVMVMKDSAGIRDTHVLIRGNYDAPGEVVDFKTPDEILPFDTTRFEKNRLGLAKWLLDKKHPLTARVFVNRVWLSLFGRGLVKTAGDFGLQGEFPSHPELLDWLSVDFRENNWDIKGLVKKIVTSATYMQSSVTSEEKQAKDPENIYFSHSSRVRLDAEIIRDHVLASSGLLHPEIGGPSLKPYQPAGLWQAATSGRGILQSYLQDQGNELYRRGMYTFIKRTVPPPSMLIFDASNREQCEVKRLRTNTPLQALVMLNDPHVLEASRVLSEQLQTEGLSPQESFKKAFRRIICREAKEDELAVLSNYYEEVLKDFSKQTSLADEFLQVGEYTSPKEIAFDNTETAALMQVVHTIYNLEEAIMRQ